MWLAVMRRLSTCDNLLKMGVHCDQIRVYRNSFHSFLVAIVNPNKQALGCFCSARSWVGAVVQ
ncbi:hypothetical protein SOVF_010710 isoform A [Spinacia oleracea]|nr:hypothetical protein SOVF_010710 isoform A [Spinacia oleracea]